MPAQEKEKPVEPPKEKKAQEKTKATEE